MRPEQPPEPVYPLAYGTEEESSYAIRVDRHKPWHAPDDTELRELAAILPARVRSRHDFLTNGSKVYSDGKSLEFTTPECLTPEDTARYIRSNERLMVYKAEHYARHLADTYGEQATIRLQRRVRDGRGQTKGCHDNFGVTPNSILINKEKLNAPKILLGHLATRGVVTGAGYVHANGIAFSQKAGSEQAVVGYGFSSMVYRVAYEEYNSPRIEIRNSDINVSDWAAKTRLGMAAIALSVSTSNVTQLEKINEDIVLNKSKLFSRMPLQLDGRMAATGPLLFALTFQRDLARIFLDTYGSEKETPAELIEVATEQVRFCDDFFDHLKEDDLLTRLSDRADWAAKMRTIVHKARRAGAPTLNDALGQQMDMAYDLIKVDCAPGLRPQVKMGIGYRLRDEKGMLRDAIDAEAVETGVYEPPADTRAHTRAQFINSPLEIRSLDWAHVIVPISHEGRETIRLIDPRMNAMSNRARKKFNKALRLQQQAPVQHKLFSYPIN